MTANYWPTHINNTASNSTSSHASAPAILANQVGCIRHARSSSRQQWRPTKASFQYLAAQARQRLRPFWRRSAQPAQRHISLCGLFTVKLVAGNSGALLHGSVAKC